MSIYALDFSQKHSYSSFPAITVPVVLLSDVNTSIDFQAKVDTGSTYCIFEKRYAEWLDLDLVSGILTRIETPTGSFYCYGHELTVSVSDIEWRPWSISRSTTRSDLALLDGSAFLIGCRSASSTMSSYFILAFTISNEVM